MSHKNVKIYRKRNITSNIIGFTESETLIITALKGSLVGILNLFQFILCLIIEYKAQTASGALDYGI